MEVLDTTYSIYFNRQKIIDGFPNLIIKDLSYIYSFAMFKFAIDGRDVECVFTPQDMGRIIYMDIDLCIMLMGIGDYTCDLHFFYKCDGFSVY